MSSNAQKQQQKIGAACPQVFWVCYLFNSHHSDADRQTDQHLFLPFSLHTRFYLPICERKIMARKYSKKINHKQTGWEHTTSPKSSRLPWFYYRNFATSSLKVPAAAVRLFCEQCNFYLILNTLISGEVKLKKANFTMHQKLRDSSTSPNDF